jgi:hypothetical protein
VFVEGGLYHVYNRFARGENVFAGPEEAIDVDHALIGFGDTLKVARRHSAARVRAGMEEDETEGAVDLLSELLKRDRKLDAPEPVIIDELGRSTGLERPATHPTKWYP